MNEYTHKCIKCTQTYKDIDPDPYYCESCNKVRMELAKEIDKKMANHVSTKEAKSGIQIYNELPKKRGFVSAQDLHNMGLL